MECDFVCFFVNVSKRVVVAIGDVVGNVDGYDFFVTFNDLFSDV
jgi:hypothetical protein